MCSRNSDSNSNSSVNILFRRWVTENSDWKQVLSFVKYPYTDTDYDSSVVDIDFPFPHSCVFEIHGHTHGLICLSKSYDIYLWNPTNNEVHKLPPSIFPILEPEPDDHLSIDSTPRTVGFGYDSKSMDFKVVRVMQYCKPPGHFFPFRVELYNLSTDQWREIHLTSIFNCIYSISSFEMYHDGFYYWRDVIWEREYIQSFDMSNEVFRAIPVPECFNDCHDIRYRSLGVWNESIAIFHYPTIGDHKTLNIWEMKRDESLSNGVSWSNIFTISLVSGINKPFLFVNSDELLMEAVDGHLVSYDVNTQEFKNLPVEGCQGNSHLFIVEKSLLSFIKRKSESSNSGSSSRIP